MAGTGVGWRCGSCVPAPPAGRRSGCSAGAHAGGRQMQGGCFAGRRMRGVCAAPGPSSPPLHGRAHANTHTHTTPPLSSCRPRRRMRWSACCAARPSEAARRPPTQPPTPLCPCHLPIPVLCLAGCMRHACEPAPIFPSTRLACIGLAPLLSFAPRLVSHAPRRLLPFVRPPPRRPQRLPARWCSSLLLSRVLLSPKLPSSNHCPRPA